MKKSRKAKKAQRKRFGFMVAASMADFIGSVGSFVMILVFIALITALLAWFRQDIYQTLNNLQKTINAVNITAPN